MIKTLLATSLTVALLAVSGAAQKRTQIFRSITVGELGKPRVISLGGELTKVVDLLVKTGDRFILTHGFGGADHIAVLINDSGTVREIIFEYGADADFDKKIASYTKTLGRPLTRAAFSSGILKARLVAWDDGKTRFEVVEKSEAGQTTVYSAR